MSRLRIATCQPLPEPDPDEALLLTALRGSGIDAHTVAWHDDGQWRVDHPDHRVPTLIRSTWDYIHRLADFERWLQQLSRDTPVWNPWPIISRNLHKRYLLTLNDLGVATTPTICVSVGSAQSLSSLVAGTGWEDVVIKPAVSAGSFGTYRVCVHDVEAEQRWAECLISRDMLIQPYQPSVEAEGERALVWIDGHFTHAVRKTPRFASDAEQVSAALPISRMERELGEAALAALIPGESRNGLLYARVDMALDASGQWRVMELELIEPSLFLLQHPPALHRLVAALNQRI